MNPARILPVLAAALLAPTLASANERKFTYTYESAVLPQGARELEIWTTNRVGREERYNRFDNRLEFEVGLTDRLLHALYLNSKAFVAGEGASKSGGSEFTGISSEWKYKLSDAAADAVGMALYGELSYGPEELEIEAKFIVDKVAGSMHYAANLVLEYEVEDIMGENEAEQVLELDLAAAYSLSEHFSLGLEARTHTERAEGEIEHTSVFAGPALAWNAKPMWIALTGLYQLGAFGGEHSGFEQDLHDHEKVNVRLISGFGF